MTKLKDVARAIEAARTIAMRCNKFRADGCIWEVVRLGEAEPVLLEAFRDYREGLDRAHAIGFMDQARAAIAALREPSEAMLRVGPSNQPRAVVWRKMIDALLAEAAPSEGSEG